MYFNMTIRGQPNFSFTFNPKCYKFTIFSQYLAWLNVNYQLSADFLVWVFG